VSSTTIGRGRHRRHRETASSCMHWHHTTSSAEGVTFLTALMARSTIWSPQRDENLVPIA
jgi:hypothetical protein